jgi:hypothetical protein
VLRTLAVPPLGVQVGDALSLPVAIPPLVAVALTLPPTVAHVAVAWAFLIAFAEALQKPSAVALAVLPLLALAVALPATTELASASLIPLAFAIATPS